MPRVWDVPVRDSTRVRDARVAAEDAAAMAGLDDRRTAAAALVATELATNLLKHAEGGQVLIDVVTPPVLREGREGSRAVQIAAIDHGPGIADVPAALRDGFSTSRSLGAGLGTCLRLSDDFALHSAPGRGTVAVARVSMTPRGGEASVRPAAGGPAPVADRAQVTAPGPYDAPGRAHPGTGAQVPPTPPSHALRDTGATGPGAASTHDLPDAGTPALKAARGLADADADPARRTAPFGDSPDRGATPQNRSLPVTGVRVGGVNIPYGGAEYSGDAWAWVRAGDRVTLMLADGLGHGPEAARASSAAVAALYRWAHLSPAESLGRLHDALKGTRGAAVAMAQLDLAAGRLRFAGIGNVGARLHTGGTWHHLLSRPGIVGVHRPATLREEEADWTDDPLLILHTDGLPSRWTPPSGPGLPAADPAVTAAVTIRDTSSPARPVRDDTAVAVLTSTPPERP
ncbi:SpoIIE family protein phosphatase [Streptomyces massasporeus]|uniref:SpoIIE family protein phosphatase n=1 Tax=Streptomyces massasporeus TaxID=67324 RepID=UPI0033ABBAE5